MGNLSEIKLPILSGHYDYDTCKKCGGDCCKIVAGLYSPKDFKEPITAELILSLLKGGKIGIDWWEGDIEEYYLRPRHKNEPAIKGSWGGECINFSQENGCSLSENERPYQCRMVKPSPTKFGGNGCDTLKQDKAEKYGLVTKWQKYSNEINEAIDLFNKL